MEDNVRTNRLLGPWEVNWRSAFYSRRDFGELTLDLLGAVHFGSTAEQWSKEGKYALNWIRPSCKDWSLRTLREKLVRTGTRVI